MVSIDSSSTTGLSVSCRILLPPCKFQSQRQCSCRAVGEGRAFVTGFSETFSWHFWGEESGPLLRQSGQHRFPSCSYDAIQKQHKKKKKNAVFRGFLPSLENKLSCRHKGKGRTEIIYPAAARNRRAWLEGKLVVG